MTRRAARPAIAGIVLDPTLHLAVAAFVLYVLVGLLAQWEASSGY